MLKEAVYYSRFAWHFNRYLRLPPLAGAKTMLRRNLDRREDNFLELARSGIFDNPRTPYRELMRLAGCTLGDLTASVGKHGLEATLERLRRDGVYLTHDEIKGKPVTRRNHTIPNDAAATANPIVSKGMESISSGSRSGGTVTRVSNDYRRYRIAYDDLLREELNLAGRATATLQPSLPAPQGLVFCASAAMQGRPADRWFTASAALRDAFHYRAVTRFLVTQARLSGYALPYPAYLAPNDFSPVAAWIASTKRCGRDVFIRGNASSCTRVCAAARDASLDIGGTVFVASGEAMTEAKRAVIESAGCRAYPFYVASEAGAIGAACPHLRGNSVHHFADSSAVIAYRRFAPFADSEVTSLLFTSLNPLMGRIFINAELDDSGTIEPAACDCAFSRLGYNTVLRDVYSFGKLTGHGLTLAGNDLLPLLEHRLPSRFGGAPGDYQLVERDSPGQIEVRLRVSPRVAAADPERVRAFFLDEIRTVLGGSISRRTWEATSALQVEIVEPHRTRTGKVMALHLESFGGRNGS